MEMPAALMPCTTPAWFSSTLHWFESAGLPAPCPHLCPLQMASPRPLPPTAVWRFSRVAENFLDLDQFLKTVRLSPSLPHSAIRRHT